jgi:formate-dependent nitrite reductase membrane component NrfD
MLGGALASLAQPLGPQPPETETAHELVRADVVFIAIELALIALLLVNLATSTPSQASAAAMITAGRYAPAFWGVVVVLGLVVPLAMQLLALGHRIAHSIVPALLVLVGGFTLRWVLVHAGQATGFVQAAAG